MSDTTPIISEIVKFFDHSFFIVMGGCMTIIMVAGFIWTVFLVIKDVFPIWYKLGMGLSKRKIAIFASTEFVSLEALLIDSKIFEKNNIIQINKNDISKAAKETVFLVHWKDYQDKISEIINIKKDSTALIVYAPPNEGRIDQADMDKINYHRNAVVVNFRGRLLNDILTSLITTSYDRR